MSNLWVDPVDLDEDTADSEYAYEACKMASYLLFALSGRKYGGTMEVTEIYEPVEGSYDTSWIYRAQTPALTAYGFLVRGVQPNTSIRLRGTPIKEILSVKLGPDFDGDPVDPTTYRVVNRAELEFDSPLRAAVQVQYSYGIQPPMAGKLAAKIMAEEFVKAWSGLECNLPDRVTTVTRQGISYTILDQQDFVADLRTGIYAVDLFLKSVNPDKAQRRSKVFSVDAPRARRRS